MNNNFITVDGSTPTINSESAGVELSDSNNKDDESSTTMTAAGENVTTEEPSIAKKEETICDTMSPHSQQQQPLRISVLHEAILDKDWERFMKNLSTNEGMYEIQCRYMSSEYRILLQLQSQSLTDWGSYVVGIHSLYYASVPHEVIVAALEATGRLLPQAFMKVCCAAMDHRRYPIFALMQARADYDESLVSLLKLMLSIEPKQATLQRKDVAKGYLPLHYLYDIMSNNDNRSLSNDEKEKKDNLRAQMAKLLIDAYPESVTSQELEDDIEHVLIMAMENPNIGYESMKVLLQHVSPRFIMIYEDILHVLCEHHAYTLRFADKLKLVLDIWPEAASIKRQTDWQLPLHLLCENYRTLSYRYKDGQLEAAFLLLTMSFPEGLSTPDQYGGLPMTNLVTRFQLCPTRTVWNTVYQLCPRILFWYRPKDNTVQEGSCPLRSTLSLLEHFYVKHLRQTFNGTIYGGNVNEEVVQEEHENNNDIEDDENQINNENNIEEAGGESDDEDDDDNDDDDNVDDELNEEEEEQNIQQRMIEHKLQMCLENPTRHNEAYALQITYRAVRLSGGKYFYSTSTSSNDSSYSSNSKSNNIIIINSSLGEYTGSETPLQQLCFLSYYITQLSFRALLWGYFHPKHSSPSSSSRRFLDRSNFSTGSTSVPVAPAAAAAVAFATNMRKKKEKCNNNMKENSNNKNEDLKKEHLLAHVKRLDTKHILKAQDKQQNNLLHLLSAASLRDEDIVAPYRHLVVVESDVSMMMMLPTVQTCLDISKAFNEWGMPRYDMTPLEAFVSCLLQSCQQLSQMYHEDSNPQEKTVSSSPYSSSTHLLEVKSAERSLITILNEMVMQRNTKGELPIHILLKNIMTTLPRRRSNNNSSNTKPTKKKSTTKRITGDGAFEESAKDIHLLLSMDMHSAAVMDPTERLYPFMYVAAAATESSLSSSVTTTTTNSRAQKFSKPTTNSTRKKRGKKSSKQQQQRRQKEKSSLGGSSNAYSASGQEQQQVLCIKRTPDLSLTYMLFKFFVAARDISSFSKKSSAK